MATFAIITLGCKVNIYESEGYREGLLKLGYIESKEEYADIYVINTCAVTNTASSKSRQKITHVKKINPNAFIAVIGCYAQLDNVLLQQQLDIDLLLGTSSKNMFVQLLDEMYTNRTKKILINEVQQLEFEDIKVNTFSKHTRGFLKIQDGCNQYCSYCIIPYVRGNERSLEPDVVIEEAKLLSKKHNEIVLAGIHTGRYDSNTTNLSQLINRLLNEVEDLKRLRISSIEINEISDELINLIKNNNKIAKHLHIPIQSASNKVLSDMNRPYTYEEYLDRVNYIRKEIPNISISTDIIVGYPSETIEEFNVTLDNIKQLDFSFMHIFPYSKRDGTKAALIKQQLDNKTKKDRSKQVAILAEYNQINYNKQFIGKELSILIESNKGNVSSGYSSEYIKVEVDEQLNINEFYNVVPYKMIGTILLAKVRRD